MLISNAISTLIRKPLKLTAKLFIAMVVVNIMLITAMAVGARLSFERGFLGYLAEEDLKRLDGSVKPLAAAYKQHGSWEFLMENHHLWHLLILPLGHDLRNARDQPLFPPPMADLVGANLRFSLLDANGEYLIGNTNISHQFPRRPIIVDGKTVGFLEIVPFQTVTEAGGLRLEIAERDASWTLAVVATLLAILISLWLARALGMPLQKIARATHALAGGEYTVRVAKNSGGELGQLESDFNYLALTLERNEKMRAALVADLSHELRTPLAVMRGEVEALEVGIRPMSQEAMRSLAVELNRLNRLVDDLHHLSLSDAGDFPYYFSEVDIVEALEDVSHSLKGSFALADISMQFDSPETPCWVMGDERRLQQVFSNIFQNVLRYVKSGSTLLVVVKQTADAVSIDFQDNGEGVPEDALSELFKRFFRVETSRSRATGGAGLGLSICRSIVEAHHGAIAAAAAPAGGLWVAIRLPRPVLNQKMTS